MLGGKGASAQDIVYQRRLHQKEAEIAALQERVHSLSQQLATSLMQQNQSGTTASHINNSSCSNNINNINNINNNNGSGRKKQKRRFHPLSPHAINVREVRTSINGQKRGTIQQFREKIGRTASIDTRRVLDTLAAQPHYARSQSSPTAAAIQRILDMFQRPAHFMDYLNSEQFAKDLLRIASKVRHLLEREPRCVFLSSPAYVFGDIHGNLEDLHFFSDNLWRLGMSLTAGNFVFLGDYVDRGLNCLECVAYLFAMKLELPQKVFLLRGNHETRDVNGWEEHYADRSFIYQCRSRFGDDIGYRLWEACNQVFDRLPLAAVLDQDIFCVHGGIPRPISPLTTRIQDILTVPKVAGINPPYEHEDDNYQQVASDCIWSDPASEEQEMTTVDPETGYGESLRGGGAICFGSKAVTLFLQQQDFSYILRAHEAHAEGVAVSKGARVFTVFSTSKDHNQGAAAMAGCMLVDNDKLQVINRSPAYKNQYVHRRDSITLAALSEQEIQKRIQLGLVTAASQDDNEQPEEWEELPEDAAGADSDESSEIAAAVTQNVSDDVGVVSDPTTVSETVEVAAVLAHQHQHSHQHYVLDSRRRSSIDLASISENSHDAAAAAVADWDSVVSSSVGSFTASAASDLHILEPSSKRFRAKKSHGTVAINETIAEDECEGDDVDNTNGLHEQQRQRQILQQQEEEIETVVHQDEDDDEDDDDDDREEEATGELLNEDMDFAMRDSMPTTATTTTSSATAAAVS